jgi:multidrug efflux pump subunit AcrB
VRGARTCSPVSQGGDGAVFAVQQLPGSNAIAAAEGVRAVLEDLKTRFPAGDGLAIPYVTTEFVQASIDEVIHNARRGLRPRHHRGLLFLGNLRATLIPLIAVPVALIGTFAVMLALGFSAKHRPRPGARARHRHRGG